MGTTLPVSLCTKPEDEITHLCQNCFQKVLPRNYKSKRLTIGRNVDIWFCDEDCEGQYVEKKFRK